MISCKTLGHLETYSPQVEPLLTTKVLGGSNIKPFRESVGNIHIFAPTKINCDSRTAPEIKPKEVCQSFFSAHVRLYNSNVASGATPIGSAAAHPTDYTSKLKYKSNTAEGVEDPGQSSTSYCKSWRYKVHSTTASTTQIQQPKYKDSVTFG